MLGDALLQPLIFRLDQIPEQREGYLRPCILIDRGVTLPDWSEGPTQPLDLWATLLIIDLRAGLKLSLNEMITVVIALKEAALIVVLRIIRSPWRQQAKEVTG